MQRAAASSNRSLSTTPNAVTRDPTAPPSAKRQKLTESESSTSGTPASATPKSTDLQAVSAALAAEEKSRSEARLRSAAAGGETEWILELPGTNGSTNGDLRVENDSADHVQDDEAAGAEDDIWPDHAVGRRSYGAFKRKNAQAGTTSSKLASEDDEELSEADVSYLEAGVSQPPMKRLSDLHKERAEEKRWQAMDRMNLKKQTRISGFSPKGAPDDRRSKVKSKSRHSFKS